MELKVTTLDGKEAGLGHAQQGHLRPRAARRPDPALRRVAARQAPRRHPCGEEPRRDRPHRQEARTRRRAPAAPVTARSAPTCSAAAAVRSVRSRAATRSSLPKKVRALALRHALSAKAKDGGIVVLDAVEPTDAKTKALRGAVRQARPRQRADHRRRRDRRELRPRRAQHSRTSTCCRSRASTSTTSCAAQKLVLTKAAVEALEARFRMSIPTDPRHLRRHPVAGDHREGDDGVRAQPGDLQGRLRPRPSRRSRKRSRSCSTSR